MKNFLSNSVTLLVLKSLSHCSQDVKNLMKLVFTAFLVQVF